MPGTANAGRLTTVRHALFVAALGLPLTVPTAPQDGLYHDTSTALR